MTIAEYFGQSRGAFPGVGVVGVESKWMDLGALDVPTGTLWAGDPHVLDARATPVATVPAGTHHVQIKGMDFKGHRRVARVRVANGAGVNPRLDAPIAEVGTDSAWVGVCDLSAFRDAVSRSKRREYLADLTAATANGGIGLGAFDFGAGSFEMALLPSGLGDGSFQVYPVKVKRETVGFEVEFLPTGFRLDHAIPGAAGAADTDRQRRARTKALFRACEDDDVDAVRRILGEDPDMVHARGPLGLLQSVSPLQMAAVFGAARVAALLLKAGHPVEAADENGDTPLIDASKYGHPAVVRLLLKHKADVNQRPPSRSSPLHEAVLPSRSREHPQVVRLLLDAGADPNARDGDRKTPLSLARSYVGDTNLAESQADLKEIVDLLAKHAKGKQTGPSPMIEGAIGAPAEA